MLIKMILSSVSFLLLNFGFANNLQECKNQQDKINGCIEISIEASSEFDDGYWKFIIETPYKNGKKNGLLKWYYEDGSLMSETPYGNDKAEGMARWYDKSGNLESEIPFKNNRANGVTKTFYKNGNLETEIPTKNNNAHGVAKQYFESGALKIQTHYKNGKKHGIEKYYFEDGALRMQITYKDNKPIAGMCVNKKILNVVQLQDIMQKDFDRICK